MINCTNKDSTVRKGDDMFQIDAMSRVPVYEQIVAQAEQYILRGILRPGDKMPSVRSLSLELSINPNTIQKAYGEMDHRGLVVSVPGKGIFVSDKVKEHFDNVKKKKIDEIKTICQELKLAGVLYEEIVTSIKEVFDK